MAKKSRKLCKREDWRTFGVTGACACAGTTHFSILAANYLTGVYREETAVLEWNENRDFEKMEQVCTGKVSEKKPFRVLEVDYYKRSGMDDLIACMKRDYAHLIIDFGCRDSQNQGEFYRCDRHAVLLSLSEWQQPRLGVMGAEAQLEKSWIYLTSFGSEETRREVNQKLRFPVMRFPFSVDAFTVTREIMDFFNQIM